MVERECYERSKADEKKIEFSFAKFFFSKRKMNNESKNNSNVENNSVWQLKTFCKSRLMDKPKKSLEGVGWHKTEKNNYNGKNYGPRYGEYVRIGDSVGVVMDTAKGELSFTLDGVNLGVAYEGIPLDKPLVPCVVLCNEGDSVELDTSEVKENAGG